MPAKHEGVSNTALAETQEISCAKDRRKTHEGTAILTATHQRNSFDFLRFTLAVFVIVAHSYALSGLGQEILSVFTHGHENFGSLAVAGFFAISGNLITRSYQRSPSVWRYLWHRFLRIYPGFWVCLLITIFVFAPAVFYLENHYLNGFIEQCGVSNFNYILANFSIKINQHNICNLLTTNPTPLAMNGSLWTLYDEVRCYLLVALIGILGGLNQRKWLFKLAVIGIVAAYAASLVFSQLQTMPFLGGAFLRNSSFFFVGGLFNLYENRIPFRKSIFLICLSAFIACAQQPIYAFISIFILPYILFWLGAKIPLTNWAKNGDYSYGLYIYAFPVQQILFVLGVQRAGIAVFFISSVAGAFVLAFLSCHLIERPALRLKQARFPRKFRHV